MGIANPCRSPIRQGLQYAVTNRKVLKRRKGWQKVLPIFHDPSVLAYHTRKVISCPDRRCHAIGRKPGVCCRPTHAFSALSDPHMLSRRYPARGHLSRTPSPPIAGGGHHSLQMRMHLVASAPYRGLITITCVVHMSLRQKLYNPWSEINLKLMYIVPRNTLTSLMRSGAYFSVQHAMTTASYDVFRTGCAMG